MPRPKPPDRYHHGQLRDALLQASADLADQHGPEGVTLREAARRAGVSHTAPYRHFADRDALLEALARDGNDAIFAALEEIGVRQRDPLSRLRARLLAFSQVARARPGWFDAVFARGPSPALRENARAPLDLLIVDVSDCQRRGRFRTGSPRSYALMLWSLARGAASLSMLETIDEVEVATIIESGLDALRAR